ncbi:maleylacetoacetate isomerase [Enterovibrio norvegicus FF-162]|uniref:Maleylacetoacetate isomerase n=1 Tax=Enterovibrio norvegicus FF-454 TaxID=1185651 RepID=A0A1E5CF06_9GAMM|nr:maleylacetoacetate isomerase [Enterovibrio norvegicus]OEE64081.1 maleylacetoacetate isomerase [Enterovibrio norvegicus FF-454]OEE80740.1 maleylacetoacetate isomerase [Enterovibrio norvegicus FF-162]
MKLYDYSKSSASYRVRIALNVKGLSYQPQSVSLLDGDQKSDGYMAINPSGLVPTLVDNGQVLTQSLAIIEYLEEVYPSPSILPTDSAARAKCRALALDIACDTHPLNNLRVLKHLTGPMGHSEDEKLDWYLHWLRIGLSAVEKKVEGTQTAFCCDDMPTLADIFLIPQLFNARRYHLDLTPYPTLKKIEQHCQALPAFEQAHPDNV